jgi:hypothetical protein
MVKQNVSYIMPSVDAREGIMDDETLKKMRDECIKFETHRARWLRWAASTMEIEDLPDDDDDNERESQ